MAGSVVSILAAYLFQTAYLVRGGRYNNTPENRSYALDISYLSNANLNRWSCPSTAMQH